MIRQDVDMMLLRGAKNGRQKAFAALFNYYYQQVYFCIFYIIKDPLEAEDLSMIAFEKAFAKLDRYAPFYTFKSWLMKIARNTALDFVKYRSLRPRQLDVTEVVIATIETPEAIVIAAEARQTVNRAVSAMPFKCKRVLALKSSGLRCREIAARLGMPLGTVTVELQRAKNNIKCSLIKNCA